MKRFVLAASALLAVALPSAVAQAKPPTRQHAREYTHAYDAVARKFGRRVAGCDLLRKRGSCHVNATDADVVKSLGVLDGMLAPPAPAPVVQAAPAASASSSSYTPASSSSAGGYADVPGVPSSFASCVAQRESTDGAGSSNIYGIEGPGGQGSLAEQKAAFSQMYASRGTEPWAPYDGC